MTFTFTANFYFWHWKFSILVPLKESDYLFLQKRNLDGKLPDFYFCFHSIFSFSAQIWQDGWKNISRVAAFFGMVIAYISEHSLSKNLQTVPFLSASHKRTLWGWFIERTILQSQKLLSFARSAGNKNKGNIVTIINGKTIRKCVKKRLLSVINPIIRRKQEKEISSSSRWSGWPTSSGWLWPEQKGRLLLLSKYSISHYPTKSTFLKVAILKEKKHNKKYVKLRLST